MKKKQNNLFLELIQMKKLIAFRPHRRQIFQALGREMPPITDEEFQMREAQRLQREPSNFQPIHEVGNDKSQMNHVNLDIEKVSIYSMEAEEQVPEEPKNVELHMETPESFVDKQNHSRSFNPIQSNDQGIVEEFIEATKDQEEEKNSRGKVYQKKRIVKTQNKPVVVRTQKEILRAVFNRIRRTRGIPVLDQNQ